MDSGNTKSSAFKKIDATGVWYISGVHIRHYDAGGTDGVFTGGWAMDIRDCSVIGCNRFFRDVDCRQVDDPCFIERNFLSGASDGFIGMGRNVIFRNNIVKDIGSSWPVTLNDAGSGPVQAANNLIIDGPSGSFGFLLGPDGTSHIDVELINNIIVNTNDWNGKYGVQADHEAAHHDLVVGGFDDAFSDGWHTGSLTASLDTIDDIFVDWSTAFNTPTASWRENIVGYQLKAGSVAADAGSSGSLMSIFDDYNRLPRTLLNDGTPVVITSSLWLNEASDAVTIPMPEFDDVSTHTISTWVRLINQSNAGGYIWCIGSVGTDETSLK